MLTTKNFKIEYKGMENNDSGDMCNYYTVILNNFDCLPIEIEEDFFGIKNIFVDSKEESTPEEIEYAYKLFSLIENDVNECIAFMLKFSIHPSEDKFEENTYIQ